MNYTARNILVFSLLIFIVGCLKEYSYEGGPPLAGNGDTTNNKPVKSEWEFTESNTLYHGPVDTAWLSNQENGQIIIATGRSVNGKEKLYLHIKSLFGPIEKGKTYSTLRTENKFVYFSDSDTIYSAIPYKGGDIYLTVTEIGGDRIVGSFKGLAIDKNGRPAEVINGKFSSPLKTKPLSQATGQVILWARENCNGPVKVKFNNQFSQITVFSGIPPECGDAGRPTFEAFPGFYSWTAYCSKDSITGKVEVKANSCSKVEIIFPFRPPPFTETTDKVCKLSDLSYDGCLLSRCEVFDGHKPVGNSNAGTFKQDSLVSMFYTSIAAGFAVGLHHSVNYEPGKIIIDKNAEYQSSFIKDAGGKITSYHGLADAVTILPIDSIIANYEYDNNNNLVRRTQINARERIPKRETNFIWQNGNVVKIVDNNLASGTTTETEYEYYAEKLVRAQPFIFTEIPELLLLQPALNMGNTMRNPIKRQIIKAFDFRGNPVSSSYYYNGYIIDENGYILHLSVSDGFGKSSNFDFKYKCF